MYSDKAFAILNSSINSAVFIDDKAKDFYSGTPIDTGVVEEKLSGALFKTFKENGKSLLVHKFQKEQITDNSLINYLFTGKDLILLDWELNDNDGQQYSLELLAKSIEAPYINFCCIYSRAANFDKIPLYLTAYFSGLQKDEIENIKNTYAHVTIEEIAEFQRNPSNSIDSFFEDNQIVLDEFPIERFRDKSKNIVLDLINISLDYEKYFFKKKIILTTK
ncbi:response regulator receiver domain [Niabella hibiscisoli]|uniref:response regulator receiver domain n=1 Tax=Niabella hibiscisoli TaxID=1825928 RepID=UPI001F0F996E|nr:response regulator receiver domain [Niabella hibiscisoli]MCH5719846.1 response regulator receiver domain [Niabella hibiscisoli]MCH5719860.1 response regulator receiver domain [Niabella hibiscisoli]